MNQLQKIAEKVTKTHKKLKRVQKVRSLNKKTKTAQYCVLQFSSCPKFKRSCRKW